MVKMYNPGGLITLVDIIGHTVANRCTIFSASLELEIPLVWLNKNGTT